MTATTPVPVPADGAPPPVDPQLEMRATGTVLVALAELRDQAGKAAAVRVLQHAVAYLEVDGRWLTR